MTAEDFLFQQAHDPWLKRNNSSNFDGHSVCYCQHGNFRAETESRVRRDSTWISVRRHEGRFSEGASPKKEMSSSVDHEFERN